MSYTHKMVDGKQVPLTQEEINELEARDAAWELQRIEDQKLEYMKLRSDAYPSLGDQLDAIWKQLNYDRLNGRPLIQDADDILGQILQVKEDYPKPVDK